MLFEVRLRDSAGDASYGGLGNPEAVQVLLYQGPIPADRKTEIYETKAVDNAYTILINYVELNYQLCSATDNADPIAERRKWKETIRHASAHTKPTATKMTIKAHRHWPRLGRPRSRSSTPSATTLAAA